MERTPGQLLRDARRRHGVSQMRLAIRAGTTQSAISRIESGRVSPTVATLSSLLQLLGEDLELGSQERDSGIDRSMIRERFRLDPSDRVEGTLQFADFVLETQRANRTHAA
jgi:transcriptional regulator with XRE-family HTH domain